MKDQFILAHYAHCNARGAASMFLLAVTDTRILFRCRVSKLTATIRRPPEFDVAGRSHAPLPLISVSHLPASKISVFHLV